MQFRPGLDQPRLLFGQRTCDQFHGFNAEDADFVLAVRVKMSAASAIIRIMIPKNRLSSARTHSRNLAGTTGLEPEQYGFEPY